MMSPGKQFMTRLSFRQWHGPTIITCLCYCKIELSEKSGHISVKNKNRWMSSLYFDTKSVGTKMIDITSLII